MHTYKYSVSSNEYRVCGFMETRLQQHTVVLCGLIFLAIDVLIYILSDVSFIKISNTVILYTYRILMIDQNESINQSNESINQSIIKRR